MTLPFHTGLGGCIMIQMHTVHASGPSKPQPRTLLTSLVPLHRVQIIKELSQEHWSSDHPNFTHSNLIHIQKPYLGQSRLTLGARECQDCD